MTASTAQQGMTGAEAVDDRLTGAEIARRIDGLLPEIRDRAAEFEAARRIPPDMVDKLRAAGCFRICVPADFGGAELDISERLELLAKLAQADASVGWTVAIANASAIIAVRAPRETVEAIFAGNPDTVLAGTAGPQGTAVKVDGGYCISGRWQWASGSLHAQWLTAHCVLLEDGKPVRAPGQEAGPPLMRMAIIPRDAAEIIDTWHVSGLCATGSNDFATKDLFVPDARMLDFFGGAPCVDAPVYRSYLAQAGLMMAALAIGIGRGALGDVLDLTQARKQRMFAAKSMAQSEIVQLRVGTGQITLEAAMIALQAKAREYVDRAGELLPGPAQLRHPVVLSCSAIGSWAVAQAARTVEAAYDAGGGSSVWRSATLQRRLRDIKTLTSHIQTSEAAFVNLGKALIDGALAPF